jgi:hypothetical protein
MSQTNRSEDGGRCFTSLPWEGIVKLILTGIGIIVSIIATNPDSSNYVGNIR